MWHARLTCCFDIWQMLCIYMFLKVLLNILFPQVVQQILLSVEGSSLNPLLFFKLDILVALIQKPSPIWLSSTFDGFETEKHCHSFPLLEYKYVLCGQQSYTSPGKSCCNENNSSDHVFYPYTFFLQRGTLHLGQTSLSLKLTAWPKWTWFICRFTGKRHDWHRLHTKSPSSVDKNSLYICMLKLHHIANT